MQLSKAEQALIEAVRSKAKRQDEPNRPPCIWQYARYSHLDSQEGGLSESVQTEQVGQYSAQLNAQRDTPLPIMAPLVDEAVSARKVRFRKRPEARKIWQNAVAGDHLVIARLDRAFRSVADMSDTVNRLLARGVEIHFVREHITFDQAHGKLLAHILAAVAQWHSDVLSERNKEIAAELRKRGRPNGKPLMWEKYLGTKGAKIRVTKPAIWRDCVVIYVAHRRNRWTWVTISDFMEAMLAQRERRNLIPRSQDLARRWNRRRCWRAGMMMKAYLARNEAANQAMQALIKSDTPLDQVGPLMPEPVQSPSTPGTTPASPE